MSCAPSWLSDLDSDEPEMELERQLDAQENLLDFCCYVTPWYKRAAHLEFIAPFYEAIENGIIDRLMWLTAPRHGKTELGLHHCAKYLGGNPHDQLVCLSYNGKIAAQFGGKVRNIVDRPQYKKLRGNGWGCELRPDSKAKDLWHTDHDGVFMAAGLDGGVTGFGGHGILIDDFVKGRAEADSETIRQTIEYHYSGEVYPRLMPRDNGKPGWVVMEYTTWHQSDLGQKEIQAMLDGTGDDWWVVRMPAVAEADDILGRGVGEALWPQRYPLERLDRIRAVMNRINPRDWISLFQARPAAMEGTFYKLDMMPDLDRTRVGRVSHLVVTDWGAEGDPTAHGVFEIDSRTDLALVDVFESSCDTGVGVEALLDLVAKYRSVGNGVSAWVHARGVLDKGVTPLVELRSRQRNIPLPPVTTYAETGSKEALSGTIQGYMAAGRVRFDHSASWWPKCRDQLLACWSGTHDEFADLLKMAGLHLAAVVAPPLKAYEMTAAYEDRALG